MFDGFAMLQWNTGFCLYASCISKLASLNETVYLYYITAFVQYPKSCYIVASQLCPMVSFYIYTILCRTKQITMYNLADNSNSCTCIIVFFIPDTLH